MTAVETDPKAVARRYADTVGDEGDVDAMDAVLTEHQVYHDPTGADES